MPPLHPLFLHAVFRHWVAIVFSALDDFFVGVSVSQSQSGSLTQPRYRRKRDEVVEERRQRSRSLHVSAPVVMVVAEHFKPLFRCTPAMFDRLHTGTNASDFLVTELSTRAASVRSSVEVELVWIADGREVPRRGLILRERPLVFLFRVGNVTNVRVAESILGVPRSTVHAVAYEMAAFLATVFARKHIKFPSTVAEFNQAAAEFEATVAPKDFKISGCVGAVRLFTCLVLCTTSGCFYTRGICVCMRACVRAWVGGVRVVLSDDA